MINRIEVRRYRCLEHVEIDLVQFAVVVGANGAGKSTLLDVPRLLGDCLRQRDITLAFTQRQNDRPPRCGSLRELLFCGKGNDFSFAVEATLPDHVANSVSMSPNKPMAVDTIRYELRLEIFNERQIQVKNEYLYTYSSKASESTMPRGGSGIYGEHMGQEWRYAIAREYGRDAKLKSETRKNARPRNTKVEPSMLALPRVMFESREDYPAAIWFHDLLTQHYLFYQPDLTVLQAASPPGASRTLQPNAQNLPQMAFNLQKDSRRFALWQEHVRTALPNVEQIEVIEREEDHHCYFRISYTSGFDVTSSGLSEGTLCILALTILPYLNDLPDIVFLEEPENGIHPQAIEAVLQSLSSVYESQILLSSHSPVVLANVKLEQVICTKLDKDGAVSIIPGHNHPQLKEWKGRVDLGALFAAGVLG